MAMTPEDMAHLNFIKKQQWNVAYYALLLLAAVSRSRRRLSPCRWSTGKRGLGQHFAL
jgi:hypothetical protein